MLRSFTTIRDDPLKFLATQWKTHGDVVQFPVPGPTTLLLSDPAVVHDVLVRHNHATSKRTLQYDNLSLLTGSGLLTADDPPWRTRRRAAQPAFHPQTLGGVDRAVDAAITTVVDRWHRNPAGSVVDVESAMMEISLQVVARQLFGSDWRAQAGAITHATIVALDEVVRRARNPLAFPLVLPTRANLRLRHARAQLDAAVSALIAQGVELDDSSLVSHLVGALRRPDGSIDSVAVRDELVTFLIAGHETVASALTWALVELVNSPEIYQRVRIDGADYAELVVAETLRKYPPAWVITRRTTADIRCATLTIPAGALLMMSPWIVHRHPDFWPEPELFRPDRFQGADSGRVPAYLPFGLGSRMCIGRDFALRESSGVLHQLLSRVDFPARQPVDSRALASVTLRPRSGLKLAVRIRER